MRRDYPRFRRPWPNEIWRIGLVPRSAARRAWTPHDNTADIKQAVLRAVPAYVAEYDAVDARSATTTSEQISVPQDGPTTEVATMSYLAGSKSHEAQFTRRKYDTGWRVKDVQPMG